VELYELTINEAHRLLKNKKITSRELTRAVLDRIDAVESKIDAYITISEELAMQQAGQADEAISKGKCLPLTGIPLGIKDLICTQAFPTTCGSRILENFVPPYNATVIRKTPELKLPAIHGTQPVFPAGPAEDLRRPSLQICVWERWARIPGAPSGSRLPIAVSWG